MSDEGPHPHKRQKAMDFIRLITDKKFDFSGGECPGLERPLQEGYFPGFSPTTAATVTTRSSGEYSESRQ